MRIALDQRIGGQPIARMVSWRGASPRRSGSPSSLHPNRRGSPSWSAAVVRRMCLSTVPDEISSLERLLDLGEKTVVRWERGTVVPNAIANTALQMLRDVPGNFEYLAARRGIQIRARTTAEMSMADADVPMAPDKPQSIEPIPLAVAGRSRTPSIPTDSLIDEPFTAGKNQGRDGSVVALYGGGPPWIQ